MHNILSLLAKTPDAVFIEYEQRSISYGEAVIAIERTIDKLSAMNAKTIAIFADNQPDWVYIDLACQIMKVCCIPLPLFFSGKQILHTIKEANIDLIISDQTDRMSSFQQWLNASTHTLNKLTLYTVKKSFNTLKPNETEKITFTSGSTGDPKGVCLSSRQQWLVAQSLADTVNKKHVKHLCVLPLSTLLENIAGIYAPLLSNGSIVVSSMKNLGFNGSASFQLEKLLFTIEQVQPDSLILLPQLLLALVCAAEAGWPVPAAITFIAVGGGKVSAKLIKRAHKCRLPVYEGYGLSECVSVVSLNTPDNKLNKPGSTGKPLPRVSVNIQDSEIIVSGNIFLGYLNQPDSWYPKTVQTGDLGHLDDEGYLFIDGRKKNILVSSFGRNINPEWIESELANHPVIQQCVVIGDARESCAALIFPGKVNHSDGEQTDTLIQQWIDEVNSGLPDYAQLKTWLKLDKPLSAEDGLLTDNGRPKRPQINHYYQTKIQQMYSTMEKHI